MVACSLGHDGVARELLTRGARPAAKDADGKTCLHYSAASLPAAELIIDWAARWDEGEGEGEGEDGAGVEEKVCTDFKGLHPIFSL